LTCLSLNEYWLIDWSDRRYINFVAFWYLIQDSLCVCLRTSSGSGVYIGGGSGVAIIAAGGTDLYCHSEPPLTSGKLCFIKNFIFYWGRRPLSAPPLNRPCCVPRQSNYKTLTSFVCTCIWSNVFQHKIKQLVEYNYNYSLVKTEMTTSHITTVI